MPPDTVQVGTYLEVKLGSALPPCCCCLREMFCGMTEKTQRQQWDGAGAAPKSGFGGDGGRQGCWEGETGKRPAAPRFCSTAQERLLEAHGGAFVPCCLCPGVPQ